MTTLVIKGTGTTGSGRIEVEPHRRHDRVRIITANHGGIPVFISVTPAEARDVARALLVNAAAIEAAIATRDVARALLVNAAAIEAAIAARKARFGVGSVVRVGDLIPFMLRSDGKWVSAGIGGLEHEEILELIARAEAEGTLKVFHRGEPSPGSDETVH